MGIFRSLKTKLFFFLFLFLLFIEIVVLAAYYQTVSVQRKEEAEAYYVERVRNICEQLDVVITKLDTISSQILASHTLQEMFVKAASEEYRDINFFDYNVTERKTAQDVLWTFNSPKKQVESINVFSNSSYVGLRYSPNVSRIQEISNEEIWQVPSEEIYKIIGPHLDEWENLQEKEVISLVRDYIATGYGFQIVGTIEVQEEYQTVKDICNLQAEDENLSLIILSDEGEMIYGDEYFEKDAGKNLLEAVKETEQYQLSGITWNHDSYKVVIARIQTAGWNVLLLQSASEYEQPIHRMIVIMIIIGFLTACMISIFLAAMIGKITKPIQQFTEDIERLSKIDDNLTLHQTNVTEVKVLQNSFLELLRKLGESQRELILSKESELNLRIIGLQAQINPHFLFNSLNAISAVALEENAVNVQIMCYQLSEMYRYSSGHNSVVTLREELDYIRIYLEFMKWRYEENFSFNIKISGDCEEVRLAKMTLQPLVENCFTHGFKGVYPPYKLRIECVCDIEGWRFEVADNGTGFQKEVIDKISEDVHLIDDILKNKKGYELLKTQDMAILNIYIRLKTQYGDHMYIQITEDNILQGALVRIVVDYKAKAVIKEQCNVSDNDY